MTVKGVPHELRTALGSAGAGINLSHDDIIAKMYEASALPECWPDVLHDISQLVGARGATIGRQISPSPSFLHSAGIAELIEGWKQRGYHINNPRLMPLMTSNYDGFLSDLDLHPPEQRQRMACYAEFLIPEKADLGASTLIKGTSDGTLTVTVEGFADGAALARGIVELDALRPYLVRAAALSVELQMRQVRAGVSALERAGAPAAMLGERGQVLAANCLFEEIIGRWAVRSRERLRLINRAADSQFFSILPKLVDGIGRSVPIRDAAGAGVAALHLVPVERDAQAVFAGAATIAIVAFRQELTTIDLTLIQSLFGLTPAEAAIAGLVARGVSLDRIAAERKKSVETVRSHLKRAYMKTGTSRQGELALLLQAISLPHLRD